MVLCEDIINLVIKMLKKNPTYMEIIPVKEIINNIKFDDIINIWNCFKKYDNTFIDKYYDIGISMNNIFNENINYEKKIYKTDNSLIQYKKYIDKNISLKNLFKTHVNIEDKPNMILIGIKGTDDVFISIKDYTLWKQKITSYYSKKEMLKMFKELKKGPFWNIKMDYDKINNSLKKTLWDNEIFVNNCICIVMIT